MNFVLHNDLFGYALSKKRGVIKIIKLRKISYLPVFFYWSKMKDWDELEKKAIKLLKGKSVLDVGAGAGRHAVYLKKYDLTTVEKSKILFNILNKRKLNPLLIDIMNGELNKRFDNILLMDNNVGLTANTDKLLKILKNILNFNGRLIIVANNSKKTKKVKMKIVYGNYYQYINWLHLTKEDLIKKCKKIGFTIDFLKTTYNGYLLVLKIVK